MFAGALALFIGPSLQAFGELREYEDLVRDSGLDDAVKLHLLSLIRPQPGDVEVPRWLEMINDLVSSVGPFDPLVTVLTTRNVLAHYRKAITYLRAQGEASEDGGSGSAPPSVRRATG